MHRHAFLCVALAACKGAERPRQPAAASMTLAVGRDGSALRGVAGDGATLYASFASPTPSPATNVPTGSSPSAGPSSIVEARRGDKVSWHSTLPGTAGELVVAGPLLGVALTGQGTLAVGTPVPLRGDPASILAALDRNTGALRWRLAFDSTEWALITSLAAMDTDIIVGGSFGGTLRVGSHVVSSAGGSDGFVARVAANGTLAWLVRLGGHSADGVQGVAATAKRIALAGTFTSGADLLGQPLTPNDERSPFGDAFVAELAPDGKRRWHATFGSRADDAVAGVTIDGSGRVAVAASVREVVRVGSAMYVTQGPSDGLVVWYGDDGEQGPAVLVGGAQFDGLRAITSLGDHVVVGGFFSSAITLADRPLDASGGDDAFLAALDPNGTIATTWHVGGAGREEITSLSPIPGGFIAGVAHTAGATIEGATVPAPHDPGSGAALVVRGH